MPLNIQNCCHHWHEFFHLPVAQSHPGNATHFQNATNWPVLYIWTLVCINCYKTFVLISLSQKSEITITTIYK